MKKLENAIFHQDNATCHTSHNTLLDLDITWVPEYAPYSPDLAPLDFAVFPYMYLMP